MYDALYRRGAGNSTDITFARTHPPSPSFAANDERCDAGICAMMAFTKAQLVIAAEIASHVRASQAQRPRRPSPRKRRASPRKRRAKVSSEVVVEPARKSARDIWLWPQTAVEYDAQAMPMEIVQIFTTSILSELVRP